MGNKPQITTTISSKGQVVLPKAIRDSKRWGAGTKLVAVETADGILLRPASLLPATRLDDVCGMLYYDGPAKTIEDMNEGIMEEARRRHAHGRY